ncbi:MAG: pyridoxal-phosphate dependent enzyme [Myxococcota bacterium]
MSQDNLIFGPTYAEMKDPSLIPQAIRQKAQKARTEAPLDPINLFNINWKDDNGQVRFVTIPHELTGISANILVLKGRYFPTGSHKVGPGYCALVEKQLSGEAKPGNRTAVWPSTGNFGIGGSWVGPRMGYRSLVVLPAEMSRERFEKIKGYGAEAIATPGSESNVKEIYDKVNELKRDPNNLILNQFADFGNYRFHSTVTASAVEDAFRTLQKEHAGPLHLRAWVSAMGSAGAIGAGDTLKEHHPGFHIVGLEPVQCPTLFNVGFGAHRIEGIGDKHVTWIHNVANMDLLFCIDDEDTLRGLQLIQQGAELLTKELGIRESHVQKLADSFGMSGVCNVLGAIKTARYLGLGRHDVVATVATDGFDRYPSCLEKLNEEDGVPSVTRDRQLRNLEVFRKPGGGDMFLEGTLAARKRWHNQKYFTWVEQQGKSIDELHALWEQDFWKQQRAKVDELDKQLVHARGSLKKLAEATA